MASSPETDMDLQTTVKKICEAQGLDVKVYEAASDKRRTLFHMIRAHDALGRIIEGLGLVKKGNIPWTTGVTTPPATLAFERVLRLFNASKSTYLRKKRLYEHAKAIAHCATPLCPVSKGNVTLVIIMDVLMMPRNVWCLSCHQVFMGQGWSDREAARTRSRFRRPGRGSSRHSYSS
jgi:hypothetical protein